MKSAILLVLATLFLAGCPVTQDPVKPLPVPEVVDTDLCGEAEKNVKKLQCKNRDGTPMWVNKLGETFAETCRIAQDEGGIFLNPRCVSVAPTCKEINQCPATQ